MRGMIDLDNITEAPERQIQIIRRWFNSNLNNEIYKRITRNSKLITLKGKNRRIFLVSDDFWETLKQLTSRRNPTSLGIYFGQVDNGRFQISLPIILLIAEHRDASIFKFVLNEKGEQHILYGRNPQNRHIIKTQRDATKGSNVILVNIHGDPLGFGRLKVSTMQIQTMAPETPIIKNIVDLGWYLRKGN
jgi:ribosome biogenesis protein Nip4